MAEVPILNYPLFAIYVPELDAYACTQGRSPRDGAKISAIVICTHEAIAEVAVLLRDTLGN